MFVNHHYTYHRLKNCPKGDRMIFIWDNRRKFTRYNNRTMSLVEKREQRKTFNTWFKLMGADTLYRNDEELQNLLAHTMGAVAIFSNVYQTESEEEYIRNCDASARFWLHPAMEKVHKTPVRDKYDAMRVHAMSREATRRESEKKPRWTLNAPDKAEEFWDWYNNDNTGKPVPVQHDEIGTTA